MLDRLFTALFKKSWIALVLSAVATLITAFSIPNNVAERLPFDKYNQFVFYFVVLLASFLVVFGFLRLIAFVFRKVTKSNFSDIYCECIKDQQLAVLWKIIDSFNDDEYKDIINFIKNKNKPVIKTAHYFDGLYVSSLVISSKIGTRQVDDTDDNNEIREITRSDFVKSAIAQDRKSYKLKPVYYELLKYSLKKHNRICNFR